MRGGGERAVRPILTETPEAEAADMRFGPWPIRANLRAVCAAFDRARWCARGRRLEAMAELREALSIARAAGDVGGLPCCQRVWFGSLSLLEAWERASPEVQAGPLGRAASAAVGALIAFDAGAEARAVHEPRRPADGYGGEG
jgi:hypothetical protein